MKCGRPFAFGPTAEVRPCERAFRHIGMCGPRIERDKVVVDDPDVPSLPFGCINAEALRGLATALDDMWQHHYVLGGNPLDYPCLRRVEASGHSVTAHISLGPAVGGSWERLELGALGRWHLIGKPEH